MLDQLDSVVFANPSYLNYLTHLGYLAIAAVAVMAISLFTRPKKTFGSRYPWIGEIKYVFFVIAALGFSLLALARPYLPMGGVEYRRGAVEVVVAIDTSLSMLAPDVGDFRLEVARQMAYKLISNDIIREGDKIGLFVFNLGERRSVYITSDFERYIAGLERIRRPREFLHDESILYTNFPLVLDEMYKAIDQQDDFLGRETPVKSENRLIFLFSDGDDQTNDRESMIKSLREYKKRGIEIYTIAIGTERGYGLTNILRWQGYIAGRDYKSNLNTELRGERTRINTRIMGMIKDQTNGEMFVINDDYDDATNFMRNAVNSHRSLTQTPHTEEKRLELWIYCIIGALIFIMITILFF